MTAQHKKVPREKLYRNDAEEFAAIGAGKVPPHSLQLEEAVLGACLIDANGYATVSEILQPAAFYKEAHRAVYNACAALHNAHLPIDLLSVVNQLQHMGMIEVAGGVHAVSRLMAGVVTIVNVHAHANMLMQKFVQREVIRISHALLCTAYDDEVAVHELLNDAEKQLLGLTNNYLKKDYSDSATILTEVLTRVDLLRSRKGMMTGVPSGFACIDNITYGWQPGDLVVLAARPGVGKTALALNFARNACRYAERPVGIGFFSLEMSAPQIMQRILSAEINMPLQKIMRGTMDDNEYKKFVADGVYTLERAGIYVDDTPALTIFELRTKARRMVQKHNVGFIVVDYLQLMNGSPERNTNREQEISMISRSLKALAKELQVPVLALSQLSRAVETRHGTRMPQLSDLRESGAIEQDADLVMFIYRPEYYGEKNLENRPLLPGETHIKFAKHRNGAVGDTVILQAQLEVQRFVEAGDVSSWGN